MTEQAVLNKLVRSLVYALKANVNELLLRAAIPPVMVKGLPVEAALFRPTSPPITNERLWE